MMSQQRLGPFEMNTKTVSTRRPPLAPYNKVTSASLVLYTSPAQFGAVVTYWLMLLASGSKLYCWI